jgi:hypothetical protein
MIQTKCAVKCGFVSGLVDIREPPMGVFRFEDSSNILSVPDIFELLRNSLHMGHKT